MRKVRAPQGKDNGYRPPKATSGKVQQRNTAVFCRSMAVGAASASAAPGRNEEPPAPVDRQKTVRMERRGKSSPDGWRQSAAVNSIRSNTVVEATGWPDRFREVARARRRRRVEIDDCQIQNPAYSFTCIRYSPGCGIRGRGLFCPASAPPCCVPHTGAVDTFKQNLSFV